MHVPNYLILSCKCFHHHSVQQVDCVIIGKMKSVQTTVIKHIQWTLFQYNYVTLSRPSHIHTYQRMQVVIKKTCATTPKKVNVTFLL